MAATDTISTISRFRPGSVSVVVVDVVVVDVVVVVVVVIVVVVGGFTITRKVSV